MPTTESLFNPVGNWEVIDKSGDYFQITINIDGTAKSTWCQREEGAHTEHGKWETTNERAIIHWCNGWQDIITVTEDGYRKLSYEPNKPIDNEPTHSSEAIKLS